MSLFNKVGRRGVTLVELVIVLALMSILSVVIVSLSSTMSSLVQRNSEVGDNITSLTLSREFIENWFYTFDESDNDYIINDGNLSINCNSKTYSISLVDKKITVEYPDNYDIPNEYYFENILSVKFENIENTKLYKCKITYLEKEKDKEFSFILGRRTERSTNED